jgi:hypothetical protein
MEVVAAAAVLRSAALVAQVVTAIKEKIADSNVSLRVGFELS